MRTSRYLSIAAATAALAILTACSSAGGTSSPSSVDSAGDPAAGPQVLTIATIQNDGPALNPIVDKFRALNPKVQIKLTTAPSANYQATLRTQLSANNGPDVMYVYPGQTNTAGANLLSNAGFLKDESTMAAVKAMPSSIKSLITAKDGKNYWLPVTIGGGGAIYNAQTMSDLGVKLPQTFNDVLAMCDTAKQKGIVAFALGGATPSSVLFPVFAMVPTVVYQPDPKFNEQRADGKTTFADSSWKTAIDKVGQMMKHGCFNTDALGVDYPTAISKVASGKALGILQTQGAIGQLKLVNPTGDWELEPVPATNTAADTRMLASTGAGYAVNKTAKNVPLAQEFLNFLADKANMATYAQGANSIPALYDKDTQIGAAAKTILTYQQEGKTFVYPDHTWPGPQVDQALITGMQDYVGGKNTAADVLKQMDSAYDSAAG